MTITSDQEERIKAALTPEDYAALVDQVETARREVRSARLDASTEKSRADQNWDALSRATEQSKTDRHLAQVGRATALRFQNPSLTYGEERTARQSLIDAHFPEGDPR